MVISMNELKLELVNLRNDANLRRYEIANDPELIHESLKAEYEVGDLSDAELEEIGSYLDFISVDVDDCIVENHHGYYKNAFYENIIASFTKRIEFSNLLYSMTYEDDKLIFIVTFKYTYYECLNGHFEIDEKSYNDRLSYFEEIDVEEWLDAGGDEDYDDTWTNYDGYCEYNFDDDID